jgi:hypothetical protein
MLTINDKIILTGLFFPAADENCSVIENQTLFLVSEVGMLEQ